MIDVRFNTAHFSRQLAELGTLLDQTNEQMVTRFARLWLQDCISLTPPTGFKKTGKKGFVSAKEQRRSGENRITNELTNAFPLLERLRVAKDDSRLSRRINVLAARGDYKAIQAIFENVGVPSLAVLGKPARNIHQRSRSKRDGRTYVGGRPLWVARRAERDAYIETVKARVGKAKGGWARPARALRIPLQGWISRHGGQPGHFRGITNRQRPSIEFGNGVPYVQARQNEIMGTTLAAREKAMASEIRRFWQLAGRGTIAKARARLKSSAFEAMEPA